MGAGRRKRRIGVCIHCRQNKLKCDSEETYPNPCSRCVSKDVECKIDLTFKRTPARQKAKEMAAELQQLRNERYTRGPLSPESYSDMGPVERASTDPRSVQQDILPINDIAMSVLGVSSFSAETIDNRFRLFEEHYHPYLPILDLPVPIGAIQRCSPLLFWTIITITMRLLPLPEAESQAYVDEFTTLLQKISTTAPLTLHSIQALIFLCSWPLEVAYQLGDPSHLYCGTAVAAAGFLNLNRPPNKRSYLESQVSDTVIKNMAQTLLGLFCVSTSVEAGFTEPTNFRHPSDLANIEAHITRGMAPPELAARAAIMLVAKKHQSLLTADSSHDAHKLLAELHLDELESLPLRFQSVWNPHFAFVASGIRLYILATLIFSRIRSSAQSTSLSSTDKFTVATGIYCAGEHIEQFEAAVQATTDPPLSTHHRFMTLPKSSYRTCVYAAFFLLRFGCSNQAPRDKDRTYSREMVARAIDSLCKSSVSVQGPGVGDEPGRSALVLQLLLQHATDGQEALRMQSDERGANGMFWQGLNQAHRLRGSCSRNTDLLDCVDPLRALAQPKVAETLPETKLPSGYQSILNEMASDNIGDDFFRDGFWGVQDFEWFEPLADT